MRLARFIFLVVLISGCSSSQPSTAPTPRHGQPGELEWGIHSHDDGTTVGHHWRDVVCLSRSVLRTDQGELEFSASQKTAIVSFVTSGGGFIGVHSAADTLYEWPEYGRLVGTHFKEHPWTQEANVTVEDQAHPATSGLGPRFSILEEFYTFRDNPRPRVQVLLSLDASSVASAGDYPLAWTQNTELWC